MLEIWYSVAVVQKGLIVYSM